MKSESGFSLAMASQPFELVSPRTQLGSVSVEQGEVRKSAKKLQFVNLLQLLFTTGK